MIRLIDSANAALFSETLKQQFANRHAVFVKEMGWDSFETAPDVERDTFDDDHAIYAVSLDHNGRAIGGIRFYPTSRPHMLSETFGHLIDGPIISKPDVFEVTRFHLLPEHRNRETYLELMVSIQEVGLHLGASGMTSILRTLRLPIILETGLAVTPLGEPEFVDGISNLAVYYEIDERILRRMNRRRGSQQSVFETEISMSRRA